MRGNATAHSAVTSKHLSRRLFPLGLLLASLSVAKRHRTIPDFYDERAGANLIQERFPWISTSLAAIKRWPGVCDWDELVILPPVAGFQHVTWDAMINTLWLIEESFKRGESVRKGKVSAINAFESVMDVKLGEVSQVLDALAAPGSWRNPMLHRCPLAVANGLAVRGLWNFSGISSWADANDLAVHLFAAKTLGDILAGNVPDKLEHAAHQGWFFMFHTIDTMRNELQCLLNEFDVPDGCRKEQFKRLRSVLTGALGENVDPCDLGSLTSGSSDIFQSLVKTPKRDAATYCEVGFHYGRSAVAALCAGLLVFSWDIGGILPEDGTVSRSSFAAGYLKGVFGDRFTITFGDSQTTLPLAAESLAGHKCDAVFIDGEHMELVVRQDFLNFVNVSAPDAVFIFDDCWRDSEPRWVVDWAARSLLFDLQEFGEDGLCILRRSERLLARQSFKRR
eukprot:TRINITY_DN12078_c2_g1_i1.p1 TRINITY_DN12078_c2_g1~~TRINITY_DN12078_c2_g1_i1.p1  ORF type:complete len:451 (+),score=75.99 TRINITY_DN12078_c2_g1_i1:181-1533(+)